MVARTWMIGVCLAACASFGSHATPAEINAAMLVEMRQILSVTPSPDGTRAVIEIKHPDVATNRVELSWVIVSIKGNAAPVAVSAGEVIYSPFAAGAPLNMVPIWSRDGRWFFYLRRDGRQVQLWKTDFRGAHTVQLTHSSSDLIGLTASTEPDQFDVLLSMPRADFDRAEAEEKRSGILYGDQLLEGVPLTAAMPIIDRFRYVRWNAAHTQREAIGWIEPTHALYDAARAVLHSAATITKPAERCADNCALSRRYRATTVPLGEKTPEGDPYTRYAGLYSIELQPRLAGEAALRCNLTECQANRVTLLGWSSDESELYFAAEALSAHVSNRHPGLLLYAWNPSANRVRLILDPNGRLFNVDLPLSPLLGSVPIINDSIVVAAEGADEPPRLVSINLATGLLRELYDPNPQLRSLTHGRARWQEWRSVDGYPGRGVVVLPEGYRPGVKYPLIITTYGCGGRLLRGGGSDGAPEFVAAQQGFLAVCLEVPIWELTVREASDLSRIYPIACDIVAAMIDDRVEAGMVDPARIGLSGQSYGADFANYCIARELKKGSPHGIAAAALRSGSIMEVEQRDLFITGKFFRDPEKSLYARMHLPDPRHDPEGRWAAMSTARKAADINTPLLIQASDTEYLISLVLWNALREAGKPVEMVVYPQELHQLIQPAHQLLNFERQMDWFRFWLRGEEDPSASKQAQYQRWRQLRDSAH